MLRSVRSTRRGCAAGTPHMAISLRDAWLLVSASARGNCATNGARQLDLQADRTSGSTDVRAFLILFECVLEPFGNVFKFQLFLVFAVVFTCV